MGGALQQGSCQKAAPKCVRAKVKCYARGHGRLAYGQQERGSATPISDAQVNASKLLDLLADTVKQHENAPANKGSSTLDCSLGHVCAGPCMCGSIYRACNVRVGI